MLADEDAYFDVVPTSHEAVKVMNGPDTLSTSRRRDMFRIPPILGIP